MSTSRQQAKRELMDHTVADLRRQAAEYWQVPGRPLPRKGKEELINMILDGREGAPTISPPTPGRRAATPYSERVDERGTHIARNRESGWSRRVGTQVNGSGGLVSTFTQATPYGTCTVTNRVHRRHVEQFRVDDRAGIAGFTGSMFSTRREVSDGMAAILAQLAAAAADPAGTRIGQ